MNKEILKPESDKLCILYNQDGYILHIHRVVSFPGSHTMTAGDIEVAAKARASKAGHDVSKLSALQVSGDKYDGSSLYYVDTKRKELVKTKEGQRKTVS
jgi:hypothetical protein